MDYTPEFMAFWRKYPARWNSNLSCMVKRKKYPAFLSWQKLSPERQQECLAKVKYIKQTEGTPRDCVTWLNQRGWDDIELEKPKPLPLPPELVPKLKTVESHVVNVSNVRNKLKDELGVR